MLQARRKLQGPVAARDLGWNKVNTGSPHVPMVHAFSDQSRIMVPTEGFQPIDFYKLFVNDDLLNSFVVCTNKYAEKWILENPALKPRSRVLSWMPVSIKEMTQFIGLTLLMLIKKPTIDQYWSNNILYHTPIFPAIMDRDRYQIILRFWHFTDPEQVQTGDKLYKIRPLLDHLYELFQTTYTPSAEVALDESLLLWKGRLAFRQYIPNKRSRFGIKVFNVCEKTGYVYRFRVYTGTQDPVTDINNILPNDAHHLGTTGKLVVFMMMPLLHKGYSLFVDNYYTSVELFHYLHGNGTNVCGTVRKNRVPSIVRNSVVKKGATVALC